VGIDLVVVVRAVVGIWVRARAGAGNKKARTGGGKGAGLVWNSLFNHQLYVIHCHLALSRPSINLSSAFTGSRVSAFSAFGSFGPFGSNLPRFFISFVSFALSFIAQR